MLNQFQNIFKSGSTTYYYSSLLFPPKKRIEITRLYAFVRTADNFVDQIPQDAKGFEAFEQETLQGLAGKESHNPIIRSFLQLANERNFKEDWIISFLQAMKADLSKNTYNTFEELEEYMHGSAEVIGLMMARIMQLPEESLLAAQRLGKAMQLINFIRDVQEDIALGRQYIPSTDLQRFGLKTIKLETEEDRKKFIPLVTFEIERYFEILKEAEEGFRFIPRQYLIPIKTASDMYKWTAKEILKNPFIIFDKKVKPTRGKILLALFINSHNSCPFLNTQKLSMFHLPNI